MKNITAHYNIYYNASELLETEEQNILAASKDDYSQLLPIFPQPAPGSEASENEALNEVITKANRIALEKYESKWVDDAFLLLAKAEFLKQNYFNSAEYYGYVAQNFPEETPNTVAALIGQAKSYFAIKENKAADSVLNIAYDKNIKPHRDELNAAIANSYINQNKPDEAIKHLKKAIDFTKNRYYKIRWTFILAQLQEITEQTEEAYANYGRVVKSNAAFEISFNANLAQIRLKENANGLQFNKIATLERLLKEDKNQEFKDQIYFQIANTYKEQGNLDLAAEFYGKSAHEIRGSQKQKGLSYLKLAELNFDSLKNYTKAQLYYDSTLQFLPKAYPDYKTISIKAANLQYLAERLTIIEKQQGLLMLAALPEEERINYANNLVKKQLDTRDSIQTQTANAPFVNIQDFSKANQAGGTFYFNNSAAISQGFNEFKKKWGNRKLEDNWRISAGISSANIAQNVNTGNLNENAVNNDLKTNSENIDSLKNQILREIPTNDFQKAAAQQKINTARYEIALFYKNELNDNNAAIEELNELLQAYTLNDEKVPEIYYQLYRLYGGIDQNKSDLYKAELLKKYPESVFSKYLNNPDYGKKEATALKALRNEYARIYQDYKDKKYPDVIQNINNLAPQYTNYAQEAPRFEYLKMLAVGNMQQAPIFVSGLNDILQKYPQDTIIAPLIKAQLTYIEENKTEIYNRPTALLANDGSALYTEPNITYVIPKAEENNPAATEKPITVKEKNTAVATNNAPPTDVKKPLEENTEVKKVEPPKPKAIAFINNARIKHAIIIDVKNSALNIAKPFATINKYFYSKFEPSNVNLTIRTISSDKLIIVRAGLNSKDAAEKALAELNPLLAEMLGLKTTEFTSFVISEPNLSLINNAESLNQYLNYLK